MGSLSPPLRAYNRFDGIHTLGDMWTMHQRQLELRCVLPTRPLGWEPRAMARAELSRSQVCRRPSDVFDVAVAWHKEAAEKGWTD